MQKVAGSGHWAVLASVVLCLPGAAVLALLVMGVEPPLGPLAPLVAAPASGPNLAGTAVALGALLLLPATALALSVPALVKGGGPIALPRLLAAAVPVAVILTFVVALAIDQYPCWAGVPNCD